jgi:hypothetical protein
LGVLAAGLKTFAGLSDVVPWLADAVLAKLGVRSRIELVRAVANHL